MKVYGVDFTSAPTPRKRITVATGEAHGDALELSRVEVLADFPAFESFLAQPGPWVAGFDFPFGLSREAVSDLGWPLLWRDLLGHCAALGRVEFKRILDTYRKTRPAGQRYATRRGDRASGAHPSVKFVNPPVAFMFFEGARRLCEAGLHVPGLHEGDRSRVALEAYPGLLVRRQLGFADSYKSDDVRRHTPERRAARRRIVDALAEGRPLGVRVRMPAKLAAELVADGSADLLDAAICAVQAAWGWKRAQSNYGLPADVDPLEGWIVSA